MICTTINAVKGLEYKLKYISQRTEQIDKIFEKTYNIEYIEEVKIETQKKKMKVWIGRKLSQK